MSVWIVLFQAVFCRAVRWRMQFSGGEKFKGRKGVACRKSHCMSVPAGTGLAKKKPAQASCRKPYVALFARPSVRTFILRMWIAQPCLMHAIMSVSSPAWQRKHVMWASAWLLLRAVKRGLKSVSGFQYTDGSPGGRVLKRLCSQKYSAGRWRTQSSRWVFMRWVSACTSSVGKSLHGSLRCTV